MKICCMCHIEKPIDAFYSHKGHRDGIGSRCKECSKKDNNQRYRDILRHDPIYVKKQADYARSWHNRNKERNNVRVSKNRKDNRMRCIDHYGGQCACCGESKYEFMAIDHVNGGGSKHRKTIATNSFHRWLIKNNFPEGYRILCHNCNQALGHYGYCPHQGLTSTEIKNRMTF
jgi:hypothetical protein